MIENNTNNRRAQFKSVVLEAPFTSTVGVISPQLEATSLALTPNSIMFPNLERIKSIECPTLIMHGTNDQVIPIEHSVRIIQECTNSNSRLFKIQSANHNNIFGQYNDQWSSVLENALLT